MSEGGVLTPQEAEALVDNLIDQFGPGSIPHVSVIALADGRWHVMWEHMQQVVAPMNLDSWRAWLGKYVGSLDAGDLGTTES